MEELSHGQVAEARCGQQRDVSVIGSGGCVVRLKQQSNVVLSWSAVKHIGDSCGDVKHVVFFVILHFQKSGKSPMFDAHFLFNWVGKNHHHTGVFLQRCVYYDQSSCLDASPRRCYKKYVNTWKRSQWADFCWGWYFVWWYTIEDAFNKSPKKQIPFFW